MSKILNLALLEGMATGLAGLTGFFDQTNK